MTPEGLLKVCYDKILSDNVTEYAKVHHETSFNEIIDIIRAKADQDYLDQIVRLFKEHPKPVPKA